MAILLSAQKISISHGAKTLFTDLSLVVSSGDRIGLIGPNGAGKSTLLRALSGEISVSAGEISSIKGLRIGFLVQSPQFSSNANILQAILGKQNSQEDWEQIALAQELISKFELDLFSESTLVESLSGGWQKRVALARELMKKPDLLLLDEPTNHLDIQGVEWLEEYLAKENIASITITHDRTFLQNVSNRIIELDKRHENGLLDIRGSYLQYLEVREQLIESQEKREIVLKNTLRRETEWLRQGAKARTTKQRARIDRAGKLEEETKNLEERNQNKVAKIQFQSADRNPKILVEAKSITKSYGSKKIFSNFTLTIAANSRIGILGKNGAGKSTLVRTLLGLETADSGSVKLSDRLEVVYFDQTRTALDEDLTVLKTLCPVGEYVDFQDQKMHIRSYLDNFLFTQSQMDMPVANLSGGEKSRLLIAQLMLKKANLLVLDEPTNDLDLATLSVLEDCLSNFKGAIVLVTHDRFFLDQVANQILAFPESEEKRELVSFADLSQWEDWHKEEKAIAKNKTSKTDKTVKNTSSSAKKKLSYMEDRELSQMEGKISELEEALSKVQLESTLPEYASNASKLTELSQKMSSLQGEIDKLYQRWSELEQKIQ
ncbi:MAG: ABC-F family ATP-binding cassette domain-containing protein [Oligoflexia bacterium]|nr:ABC-F family ATP-binding cassette domain-containing protein [Oligoflexia bacterium]